MPPAPLTATGKVILGMIGLGRSTGYDIKQLVDRSTRHFWAASYGQIYPELRRLEADGLLRSRPEPTGGRSRTTYELTDAGRGALNDWLCGGRELITETRDEGMLKLFFSDAVGPDRRRALLSEMRAKLELKLAQLEALREHAAEMPPGPSLTLEYGMGLTRWARDWCAQAEQRLAEDEAA